nr:hypothetical protein Iba_chr11dCG8450 [Ipomoea batatas]
MKKTCLNGVCLTLGRATVCFFKSLLNRGSLISLELTIVKEQLTLLEILLIAMVSLISNSWLMTFLKQS